MMPKLTCCVTPAAVCCLDKGNAFASQANSKNVLIVVGCKAGYAAPHIQDVCACAEDVVEYRKVPLHASCQMIIIMCECRGVCSAAH